MIESAPMKGEKQPRQTHVKLPITLEIIPTPPRCIPFPSRQRSPSHKRPQTNAGPTLWMGSQGTTSALVMFSGQTVSLNFQPMLAQNPKGCNGDLRVL